MRHFFKAIKFASAKHQFQSRKGKSKPPYINHLIDVSYILHNVGSIKDEEVLAASILHDTIEDTDTSYNELKINFNERIANMVLDLTDDKTLSAIERKRQQVITAPKIHKLSKLIKLADKISNIKDITLDPPATWTNERMLNYLNWAKDVVDQIRGNNKAMEEMFDEWYNKGIHHLREGSE
jgi:guanosine-3',5'-bis(diphosphate) 3'-pyrophosphohydrolase